MKNSGKLIPVLGGLLVVALVAALLIVFWPGAETKSVTADFPRTVSLYEGSEVKILGVAVGKVDKVTPSGTKVRVELTYDAKYKLPQDVKAAVISPSIVGDRFVQMTPAYDKGAVLPDKAKLGTDRTAMPLELDEIFGSINDLDKALGPDGANKAATGGVGPLTRLLDSTARNFGGQGVQFNKTLKDLGALTKTLADNKDELFGTLTQVEDFTQTLAKNDGTVRKFNDSLASGADLLAGERQELAAVLKNLSVAMREVRGFVKENRASLTKNITGLNRVSGTLVKRRNALDEILKTAPGALNNLFLSGNVPEGTLDVRDDVLGALGQLQTDPAAVLCSFVRQAPNATSACNLIKGALGSLPAAPTGGGAARVPGVGRAAALTPDASAKPRVTGQIDKSLAGLVTR